MSLAAEHVWNDAERATGKSRIAGLAICLLLIVITGATYSRVLHFGFVGYDDFHYIVDNFHLREGFTPRGLWWAFTSYDPDNWFPLTRLFHMLDFRMFGLHAYGYHAGNIAIHALACVLLYLFLARATRQRWPSAFVAAVFAVHPLHVESVAWISERKDVLCAFLWFATLWSWVRYTERPSRIRYLATLILFALGLMSKPMIVTLPVLLPVIDIWPLRRRLSVRSIALHLPFWVFSAGTCLLTVLAQRESVTSLIQFSLATRVENALATVFIYLGKTFRPTGLSIVYPWPEHRPLWLMALAAATIAGISVLFLRMRGTRPWLLAGWLWYLITLIPVIGLVQVGLSARADRYMYVPMVGILIIVAWEIDELARLFVRQLLVKLATAIVAGSVCLSLAALSWQQEQYWQTSGSLFEHAVVEDDQNYLAWEYLGAATDWNTQLPIRIECYRKALRIRPDLSDAHASLGRAYLKADWLNDAVAEFKEALRLGPDDTRTRCNLGAALLRQHRVPEAVSQFERAVQIEPGSPVALNDLAVGLSNEPGRQQDAEKRLERALALRPDDALTQSNLGLVLLSEPDGASKSVPHFLHALAADPNDVAAHLGLAKTLSMPPFSDPKGAEAHLQTARRLEPDPNVLQRFESLRIDYGEDRSSTEGGISN